MGRNAPTIQSYLNDLEFLNEKIYTRLTAMPDITHGVLSLGELRQRHLKMSLIYQQANTELSLLTQKIKEAETLRDATTEIKSQIIPWHALCVDDRTAQPAYAAASIRIP